MMTSLIPLGNKETALELQEGQNIIQLKCKTFEEARELEYQIRKAIERKQ